MSALKEPSYFLFGGVEPPQFSGPSLPPLDEALRWSGSRLRIGKFSDQPPGPQGDDARWLSLYYMKLYATADGFAAIGDASPYYLQSEQAAHNIRKHVPDAKIVAILRQPADRAYSEYTARYARGTEPARTFEDAIADEPKRLRENWDIRFRNVANGEYARQLKVYYDLFPNEQIKVYLYEDWNSNPQKLLVDLFQFLGVDHTFHPTIRRENVTVTTHWPFMHNAAKSPTALERRLKFAPWGLRRAARALLVAADSRFNVMKPIPITPDTRAKLTEHYRDDITELQGLIGRDLSHWLGPR